MMSHVMQSTTGWAPLTSSTEALSDSQVMIRVHGELDMATGDTFRHLIRSTIAAGHSNMVVDMSGVAFCDSEGLSALVDATRHAETAGGLLTLVGLHPRVAKVIRITCLDQCLHIASPTQIETSLRASGK